MVLRALTIFWLFPVLALAGQGIHRINSAALETATGIVQDTPRNTIEIYDDQQRRNVRFIYMGEEYHKGDYVRIYYRPSDGSVQFIRRLRAFEYSKDGRNLGNIYRSGN